MAPPPPKQPSLYRIVLVSTPYEGDTDSLKWEWYVERRDPYGWGTFVGKGVASSDDLPEAAIEDAERFIRSEQEKPHA